MELILKHFWIFLIAATLLNGFIFKIRSKKYILKNPDLIDGYNVIFRGFIFYGNIPWIIMAIGDLSKITNGIDNYFNPRSLNPMVIVFHISIVILWFFGSKWIYLDNGADFLTRHPGLIKFGGFGISSDITSASSIKLIWTIGLLGGIAGMIMMWTMDF